MNRRTLITGVSAIALVAAGGARAQFALMQGEGKQDEWRHCNNCFGLFYSPGAGSTGVCAFGGHHVAQGVKFQVNYSSSRRQPIPGVDSQFDWRFCEKCWLMFYDGGADFTGVCPVSNGDGSGNKHKPRGFMFGLAHNSSAAPGQGGWRFCWRCSSLFFGTAPDGATGFCPAGGKHQAASNSFDFHLPFTNDFVNAQGGGDAGGSGGGAIPTHQFQYCAANCDTCNKNGFICSPSSIYCNNATDAPAACFK